METLCEFCGEVLPSKFRRSFKKGRGQYKIVICPSCKGKNFVPILRKYHKEERI